MSEWMETNLGLLLKFANGKSSPKRREGDPFAVFGSNGVIGSCKVTNAEANTIIIGRVGSYCGSKYLSKNPCWVTDNAIKANSLPGNDSRFLFYLLDTLDLNSRASGSGQPLLNQSILSSIDVEAPPLPEQKAIAHILGSLDDKIELNRKMNETLEGMAQALFKSWFCDFDPVIDNILVKNIARGQPSPPPLPEGEELTDAKSSSPGSHHPSPSGRGAGGEGSIFDGIPDDYRERAEVRLKTLGERSSRCVTSRKDGAGAPSLPDFSNLPNIGNLFPSAFRESEELGWIPEGWEVGTIADHAEVTMGQSPKGDTYNNLGDGVPLVNGPVEFGPYFPNQSKWTTSPTKLSEKEDLIVCVRGSTTGRFVKSDGQYCLGRGVCSVCARRSQCFVDQIFKSSISEMLGLTTGSTFPNWSRQTLSGFEVIDPPISVINLFEKIMSANTKRIESGVLESSSLSKLRDTLLPKLISGELRVNQIENAVDAERAFNEIL